VEIRKNKIQGNLGQKKKKNSKETTPHFNKQIWAYLVFPATGVGGDGGAHNRIVVKASPAFNPKKA
jgi:hypothetical protein